MSVEAPAYDYEASLEAALYEVELDAESVADEAAEWLAANTAEAAEYTDKLHEMGVVETELEEVPVHGPHRLLVLDETVQPSNAFKYNGAAYAMLRAAEDGNLSRVHIASAGNAALAGTIAATRLGAESYVYMPSDGSLLKAEANERAGAKVDMSSLDIADAIKRAEAKNNPETGDKFFHAYNDEHGVAGQGLVGIRAVEGVLQQAADGKIDLLNDKIEFVIARGGGSLEAGVAVAVMQAKQAGLMDDNVTVREVRPERNPDGSLNRVFDGLAVEEPGSLTAPVLNDERYVSDVVSISEESAGEAARRMEEHNGKRYEPSGLAGVAAFEQLSLENQGEPTTYVTILSGANVTDERYKSLVDQARDNMADAYSSIASGTSLEHTRGPVTPTNQLSEAAPTAGESEAQQAYREQLEEMGIFLAR